MGLILINIGTFNIKYPVTMEGVNNIGTSNIDA